MLGARDAEEDGYLLDAPHQHRDSSAGRGMPGGRRQRADHGYLAPCWSEDRRATTGCRHRAGGSRPSGLLREDGLDRVCQLITVSGMAAVI